MICNEIIPLTGILKLGSLISNCNFIRYNIDKTYFGNMPDMGHNRQRIKDI